MDDIMNAVHVILTGGTIAKTYNPATEKTELEYDDIVQRYFNARVHPHRGFTYETPFLKDSLDITDADRAALLAAIQNTDAQKILIVHGTSTMSRTQDYLAGKIGGKTIVLTGAMYPLQEFAMSDAGFNLGFALAELLHLPAGVYLAMNARTFAPGTVIKDTKAARFVPHSLPPA